jgi:cobalamin biosynthetic protein CobC
MDGGQAADHGGGVDAAAARHGGARGDWLDLSTGINPVPWPLDPVLGDLPPGAWAALPDQAAQARLVAAARDFWRVPAGAAVVAAPGASAVIARLPSLAGGDAAIPGPTYNEHARAFRAAGRRVVEGEAPVRVLVHPNNPDGRLWPAVAVGGRAMTVVDESFCDVVPDESHVERSCLPGVIILKSFGKFWGLAGVRLGFAIGDPGLLARLEVLLGPWAVSGPALEIGARALADRAWAAAARARLAADAARLDALMTGRGAAVVGGTDLFRLYDVGEARLWQDRLARARIWTRVFPYSRGWLRLGLPGPQDWPRLEAAL